MGDMKSSPPGNLYGHRQSHRKKEDPFTRLRKSRQKKEPRVGSQQPMVVTVIAAIFQRHGTRPCKSSSNKFWINDKPSQQISFVTLSMIVLRAPFFSLKVKEKVLWSIVDKFRSFTTIDDHQTWLLSFNYYVFFFLKFDSLSLRRWSKKSVIAFFYCCFQRSRITKKQKPWRT
jgi:hypothetical protein